MAENEKNNPELNPEETPVEAAPADTKKKGRKGREKDDGLEAKLAGAEQKLCDAENAAEEARQALLRTAAEYDNHRKRSAKEYETAYGNGVAHAAEQLLPVLDTLNAAANAETKDEEYKKGVILTLAKCEEVFKKLGITEIEADGQPFNPEFHNAVMQEECEGKDSCTVTRVMQKGYLLNGRVIRHAMVAVTP